MRQLVDAISEVNSHRLKNMNDDTLLEGVRLAAFNMILRIPMDMQHEMLAGTVLWEMCERFERVTKEQTTTVNFWNTGCPLDGRHDEHTHPHSVWKAHLDRQGK